jgi:maltoporin
LQGGVEFSDKVSMKTTLMVEARGNQNPTEDGIWTAFAVRPYYAFTNAFGLTFEYDLDYFIYDDDAVDASMLNRFTLAPTITIDSNGTVFSDPVIHAFVSYAMGDMDSTVLIDGQDDQGFKYGFSFSVGW